MSTSNGGLSLKALIDLKGGGQLRHGQRIEEELALYSGAGWLVRRDIGKLSTELVDPLRESTNVDEYASECLVLPLRANMNPLLLGWSSDSKVGGMCNGGDVSGKCSDEWVGLKACGWA